MTRHLWFTRDSRLSDPAASGRDGDPEWPELPPVMMPADEGPGRARRPLRWILAVTALVAAAAWAAGLIELPGSAGGADSAPGPPDPAGVAEGASGADGPAGAAERAAVDAERAGETDEATVRFGAPPASRFDRLRDSLEVSLESYRQRQRDFERGRIACGALAAGYQRVDEAVVALAMARAGLGSVAPERLGPYDELMEDAAAVDRSFDRSSCPRP